MVQDNPVCSVVVAVAQVFEGFLWIMGRCLQVRGQWIVEVRWEGVFRGCIEAQEGENSRGPLKNGEEVTVKTKLVYGEQLWLM